MKKNLIIGLIALLIVIAVAVTVVLVIPKNGGNEQSSSADSSDVEEKQDYDMSDVCWTYSEKFVYDGEAKKDRT